MDTEAVAVAIGCTTQYARDLLAGTKIPSNEEISDIIKGLNLDDLKTDQLRTLAAEDRLKHDGRFRNVKI